MFMAAITKTQRKRIEFLIKNPALFEGYPHEGKWHKEETLIFKILQANGLYSLNTRWEDCNIEKLISQTRRERAKRNANI